MGIPHPHTSLSTAARASLPLAAGAVSLAFSLAFSPQAAAGAASEFLPGAVGPLLTAEVAARRGSEAEADDALQDYVDAARQHGSAALAERATRLAARVRRHRLAADASALWQELAPGSRGARRIHALMLVRSDQRAEAAAALRRIAREAEEDGESGGRGYDAVVSVLGQDPDPARRVRIMEAVANEGAESRFALARILAASGETARGLGILEALRREAPREDRYAIAYARLLHRHGDREAALRVLAGRRAEGSDDPALLRTYARFLAAAEQREEAREAYESLLAGHPDDAPARAELGRLLVEMERFSAARAHFDALREEPAWRDEAWYFTGLIEDLLGEPDRALRAYRQVRKGPYHLTARVRAAMVMADRGLILPALRHLASTPRFTEADEIRLYRAESEVFLRADRPGEAMKLLDGALAAYPEEADLLYARAMVAVKLDRLDVVERDLRSIIGRDPEHADALNALGYTLADRTDRFEEAHDLVERALALAPDRYHIVDSMGWVLYRLGRYEEAAGHLRRSYAMEPHPEVAAHLGEVLWVLGRRGEARAIWDAALKEDPDHEVLVETMERFGARRPDVPL